MRRCVSFVLLSLFAATASAAPYKVSVVTTVTGMVDPLNVSATYPDWVEGSVLATSFTFDSDSPDTVPASDYGAYAIVGGETTLNGSTLGTLEGVENFFQVDYAGVGGQRNVSVSWFRNTENADGSSDFEMLWMYFGGSNVVGNDGKPDFTQLVANSTTIFSSYHFTHYDPQGNGVSSQIYGNDLAVTVDAVPEPASLAALGLGAAAMLRRRKRV